MSNHEKNRHDRGKKIAGRSVGGEFAKQHRTEATGEDLLTATKEAPAHPPIENEAKEMREVFEFLTNNKKSSWVANPVVIGNRHDIIQESMIDIMVWARANNRQNLVTESAALCQSILNKKVAQTINGSWHHTAGKGRTMLRDDVTLFIQAEHREPTAKEYDEMAQAIWESFEKGRRPTLGFQRGIAREQNLSINEEPGDFEEDNRHLIAQEVDYPSLVEVE